MAERRRLLVALVIDGPVSAEVDGLRRALGSGEVDRIAPHITLVPPTNVAAAAVDEALAVLRHAAASSGALELTLGPPSRFEEAGRVVYLALSGALDELVALRGALWRGPFGGRDDPRPFVAHVTVANRATPAVADGALLAMGAYERAVRIDAVTLLEQDPTAPGHPWQARADVALGAAPVVGRGGRELRFWTGTLADASTLARRDEWLGAPPARSSPGEGFYATAFERAAPSGDALVGVATGSVAAGVLTLDAEVVAPPARGLGVGSALLAFVEQVARERGLRALALDLDADAAPFYRGRGFVAPDPGPGRVTLVRELGG